MHKDVKRLIYNEETEQSYQKAIEQCCTKQFSTTIRSRLSLFPRICCPHWRQSTATGVALALLQLHPPPPLLTAESRTDFSRLSSALMNMARLAAANDEDRPPSLENEVMKVINVWVN